MAGAGRGFGERWAAYGSRPTAARWAARTSFVVGTAIGTVLVLAAVAGAGWLLCWLAA